MSSNPTKCQRQNQLDLGKAFQIVIYYTQDKIKAHRVAVFKKDEVKRWDIRFVADVHGKIE